MSETRLTCRELERRIVHLEHERDELKQELIAALWEIREHSDYQFEKHYGELAVRLGIKHEFKYFPPAKETAPPTRVVATAADGWTWSATITPAEEPADA